mmetsp:Transcript_53830/g.159492  ORF Transcript_53830/g.159492 Transcript_53830/m.159492 type:complete len:407 (+) Transcript_53830:330-1550(+)
MATPAGYFSRSGSMAPTPCTPGTRNADERQAACVMCEAGKHQSAPGKTACIECRAGTRCPEGAYTERLCEIGTHQPERGQSECVACAEGNACATGSADQTLCAPGSYGDTTDWTCKLCAGGTYQPQSGQTSCVLCPKGYACAQGASTKEPCVAGRYGATPGQANRECTGPCLEGHYCLEGSVSNTSGICPTGRYNRDIGGANLAACELSPRGTSASHPGAAAPTDCAAGHRQPAKGQAQCLPCPKGQYQPDPGAVECRACEVGKDSVSGAAQCTLCATDYCRPHGNSSASECTVCSAIRGVCCDNDTTIATLHLVRGHWRHSTATIKTYFCKSDGSWTPCHGGGDVSTQGDGYCAEGYRGPRCELCDGPAYSRYFDKLEARCHDAVTWSSGLVSWCACCCLSSSSR